MNSSTDPHDGGTGRRNGLSRLFSRVFDHLTRGTHDPDIVQRIRILWAYAGTTFVLAMAWGTTHLVDGIVLTSVVFFSVAALVATLMAKLWWDRNIAAASHGIISTATVAITVACYITGGLRLTNVTIFFMVIVAAVFLLGRWGIPYAVACLLAPLAFQVAHWAGYEFPDVIPPGERSMDAFTTWFVSGSIVLLFVIAYERARVLAMRMLREANLARSQFLANISHAIRTPLHVIMGMNKMLEKSDLMPDQKSHVETSQQNSETLLSLIDDLMDMTSMEHGSFSLQSANFDPATVAREVSEVIRYRCEEKGLSYSFAVHPDTPRTVYGDSQRLKQVLVNIGGNAVKYTDSGAVAMEVRPGNGPSAGSACRFIMRDTGVGIEDRDRQRIFQSFTQVDGTLSRHHEGAGLGLFISRELVRLMSGRIEFDSDPGRGSIFVVEIPFEPPATDSASSKDRVA